MIALLSPAKNLNSSADPAYSDQLPVLIEEAAYLTEKLKKKSARSLSKMMNINADLGQLNFDRYQNWKFPFEKGAAIPAIHLFNGEVYRGLDSASLSEEDLAFANNHLAILSGLYGLLRPLDNTLPYRLEMGTRWAVTPAKKNLYAFWGSKITQELNEMLLRTDSRAVINLASTEYYKAVKPSELNAEVITPVFKDLKNGEYKSIMTYAKLARGFMGRYIVQHRLSDPNDIKAFDSHGYVWNKELSKGNEWVFTRDQ